MKIFSTWPLPQSASSRLKEKGFDVSTNNTGELVKKEQLLDIDSQTKGLITLLTDNIDAEVIKNLPNLKVIANVAVGYNNIDVAYATQKGIFVCNTPDILTDATADLVVAMVLSTVRKTVQADKFVREGHFTGWRPDLFLGHGFKGKKFGIFGMGKIGRSVAKRMSAFGCKIIYHNRNRLDQNIEKTYGAKYVDFQQLLTDSDYLCLLAPLTPETKGKFGSNEFQQMKKGAYFFNAARGQMMDESALVNSLKTNHIAGAGLDVYENEPQIEGDLLKMDNVVLLPHIGSAEQETREKMFSLCADNIIRVHDGKEPLSAVNNNDLG